MVITVHGSQHRWPNYRNIIKVVLHISQKHPISIVVFYLLSTHPLLPALRSESIQPPNMANRELKNLKENLTDQSLAPPSRRQNNNQWQLSQN